MSLTTHPHFKFGFSVSQIQSHVETSSSMIFKTSRTRRKLQNLHTSSSFNSSNLKLHSLRPVITRVSSSSDSGGTFHDDTPQKVSDDISVSCLICFEVHINPRFILFYVNCLEWMNDCLMNWWYSLKLAYFPFFVKHCTQRVCENATVVTSTGL